MSGNRFFVDTNIWLYALIEGDDEQKRSSCKAVIQSSGSLIVSAQVISEVCVNLLKKANQTEVFVKDLINSFYLKYEVVSLAENHFLKASDLRLKYSFSYWDSLIVAAAIESSCPILYSEDMQNGLVVEDRLTIINPMS